MSDYRIVEEVTNEGSFFYVEKIVEKKHWLTRRKQVCYYTIGDSHFNGISFTNIPRFFKTKEGAEEFLEKYKKSLIRVIKYHEIAN